MSITINWLNNNTVTLDSIKVYRSSTRNGTATLLDTLAGNVLTYTDTSAADDTLYFYRIDGMVGSSVSSSIVVPFRTLTVPGPGPSTILRGDWEFGFMGEVAASLLPAFAAIRTAAAISLASYYATPTLWYKWSVGGRIVYLPGNWYYTTMSLTSTNTSVNVGKLFVPSGSDRLTAGAQLSLNGNTFLARLPYASTLVTNEMNPNGDITANASNVITNFGVSFSKSELYAILSTLSVPTVTMVTSGGAYKFSDYVPPNGYPAQNIFTNTFVIAGRVMTAVISGGSYAASGMLSTDTASAGLICPVLELLS